MKKEIKIKNQVGELEKVNQFVEEIGEELGLDMELQMNLNLVMEEMVSNVIFYAYPEGKPEEIGMGIFIVKNIMNQVTYQRLEGKNLLTMKKEI